MKSTFFLCAILAISSFTITSCGNNSQNKATASQETADQNIMSVDSLLSQAPNQVNQTIVVEGVCTHTCQHGGTKLFLMGSNDSQTIRVEAGELGSFESKCVNQIVRISGILKEQRIDEDYLQQWEANLKEEAIRQHGEGEAGCSTEKLSRGETGNTAQERIADFRNKIAQRKAAEGKPYLSFYYIEANHYEIQ